MKAILLCLLLTGCASRYLTAEEGAALRKACEPANDCVFLTGQQWHAIEAFIAAHRGTGI